MEGITGSELSSLQNILILKEGFKIEGEITNGSVSVRTFGPSTLAAVKKFQAKYGIKQTGYVGPLTRAKLNALYGCGKTSSTTIPELYVWPTSGPAPLRVTFSVEPSNIPPGAELFIDYGDQTASAKLEPSGNPKVLYSSSHQYLSSGTYMARVLSCPNGGNTCEGYTVWDTASIAVQSSQSWLTGVYAGHSFQYPGDWKLVARTGATGDFRGYDIVAPFASHDAYGATSEEINIGIMSMVYDCDSIRSTATRCVDAPIFIYTFSKDVRVHELFGKMIQTIK